MSGVSSLPLQTENVQLVLRSVRASQQVQTMRNAGLVIVCCTSTSIVVYCYLAYPHRSDELSVAVIFYAGFGVSYFGKCPYQQAQ